MQKKNTYTFKHTDILHTQIYVTISNCAIRNLCNVMLRQKCKHNKNYVKDFEGKILFKTSSVTDRAVSHNSPNVNWNELH